MFFSVLWYLFMQYLKKLHLQERVVDEVKVALKPFYNRKEITKEQYKDVLRRAVPKVCVCLFNTYLVVKEGHPQGMYFVCLIHI